MDSKKSVPLVVIVLVGAVAFAMNAWRVSECQRVIPDASALWCFFN